jgi:hypothetical protein
VECGLEDGLEGSEDIGSFRNTLLPAIGRVDTYHVRALTSESEEYGETKAALSETEGAHLRMQTA